MSTFAPVRFGIIGTGVIAGFHAEALANSPLAKLTMVYDVNYERAQEFAKKFNCQAAATLEEFLNSEIEAVSITTPSGLHLEPALAAINHQKHILCEKPLEVTHPRAMQIVTKAAQQGVLAGAVFQSRYNQNILQVREAVQQGRFGDAVLCSARVRWYRAPEYYANNSWRGTLKLDGGGALMNQGIHTADLLLFLNGPVKAVQATMTRRLHHGIEVEDTIIANIEYINGSLGTLEASTAAFPGLPPQVEFSGTLGGFLLEDGIVQRWTLAETFENESGNLRSGSANPTAISSEGHLRQINELSRVIREGGTLHCAAIHGAETVRVITAIYESANSGSKVFIN